MAEWTAAEDEIVKAAITEGKSAADIAGMLGRTPQNVQVRMFSLKLAKPQQQAAEDSEEQDNAAAPELPASVATGKKRGRPAKKKVAAPVATGKKRGRPPKVAASAPVVADVEDEDEEEDEEEAAPVKRRGRPPKVAAAPVESVTVSQVAPTPKVEAAPAPVERARRARKEAALPFAISLGVHRVLASGAEIELIAGGGLRLKFAEGSVELRGALA